MQKWIFILAFCLLAAACGQQQEKVSVPPLKIDLPVSYKSDTVAYNFISSETETWNTFGKQVRSMHKQGEKYRKQDFEKLSPRKELALVTLDYEYALLWTGIDQHVALMLELWQQAMGKASDQGQDKLIEAQHLFLAYYADLEKAYGKDLKLDKNPITLDKGLFE